MGQTFATVIPQSRHWCLTCAVFRSGGSAEEDHAGCRIVPRIGLLPWLSAQTLVVHFSSAETIGTLNAVVKCGATIGSLHPVFAFADVAQPVRLLRGNLCALEAGDEAAMAVLHDLADAAGLYSSSNIKGCSLQCGIFSDGLYLRKQKSRCFEASAFFVRMKGLLECAVRMLGEAFLRKILQMSGKNAARLDLARISVSQVRYAA